MPLPSYPETNKPSSNSKPDAQPHRSLRSRNPDRSRPVVSYRESPGPRISKAKAPPRKRRVRVEYDWKDGPMSTEAVKRFFSSQYFAVAGASQNPQKFGYKILLWYHNHNLTVHPLNPGTDSIALPTPTATDFAQTTALPTLRDPLALPHPERTALSVVTPPAVTRSLLHQARAAGVRAVWLQPGTYDDEILAFARDKFEAGVGGVEGSGSPEGWCVLVHGEEGLRAAREEAEAGGGAEAEGKESGKL